MFLLLFICVAILSFILIIISISDVYTWFYYENINYLIKEKLYVEIRLEKFLKNPKLKIYLYYWYIFLISY